MQSNTNLASRFVVAVMLIAIINCAVNAESVCTEDAQTALTKFSASFYQVNKKKIHLE